MCSPIQLTPAPQCLSATRIGPAEELVAREWANRIGRDNQLVPGWTLEAELPRAEAASGPDRQVGKRTVRAPESTAGPCVLSYLVVHYLLVCYILRGWAHVTGRSVLYATDRPYVDDPFSRSNNNEAHRRAAVESRWRFAAERWGVSQRRVVVESESDQMQCGMETRMGKRGPTPTPTTPTLAPVSSLP